MSIGVEGSTDVTGRRFIREAGVVPELSSNFRMPNVYRQMPAGELLEVGRWTLSGYPLSIEH